MFTFRHLLLLVCLCAVLIQQNAFSFLRAAEQTAEVTESASDASSPDANAVQSKEEKKDKFYDLRNPDYQGLQKADEIRRTLPADKRGAFDWMNALRNGLIKPRSDLSGTKVPEVLNLDIILKNTKEMPYVKFPHNSHTEWLACSNCHDQIFIPKAGANPISMEKIFRGEYCGACHGRVAFITHFSCERCHSVPHGETKAWW